MALYIPPLHFGMVAPNLYRSGMPSRLNLPFLERLKLKTIIHLGPGSINDDTTFNSFSKDQGIKIMRLKDFSKESGTALNELRVNKILEFILNSNNYPLLITDSSMGTLRVSIIVGCLRKVQKWNLISIFEEYRRYAGIKSGSENEQFIELFDTDLVKVDNLPP